MRRWSFVLIWSGFWLLVASAFLLFLTWTASRPPNCIDECGLSSEIVVLLFLLIGAIWFVGLLRGLRRRGA